MKSIIIMMIFFIMVSPLNVYSSTSTSDSLCLRDCKMELQFFKRYAHDGSSIANLALAIMYYRGQGTEVNIAIANRYLEKSANMGEPVAQYQLAYFLAHGLYMMPDIERALIWYKRAARFNILDSHVQVANLSLLLQSKVKTTTPENSHFISSDLDIPFDDKTDHLTQNFNKASVVDEVDFETSTEVITITANFMWNDVLAAAKQQTCGHDSCQKPIHTAVIPRIVLK